MERIEKLPEEVLEPSLDHQAALAHEMPDRVDDDDADGAATEAAWAEEIERRVREVRDGTAELYDLEDVLAEMEERYEAEIDDVPERHLDRLRGTERYDVSVKSCRLSRSPERSRDEHVAAGPA